MAKKKKKARAQKKSAAHAKPNRVPHKKKLTKRMDKKFMPVEHVLRQEQVGALRLPFFQREKGLWPQATKQAYVDSCFAHGDITGLFTTCVILEVNPDIIFLEDGLQRFSTLQELLANPRLYGKTPAEVAALFKKATLTTEEKVHATFDDALADFVQLNLHTLPLTPKEVWQGYLKRTANGAYLYSELEKIMDEQDNNLLGIGYAKRTSRRRSANRAHLHQATRAALGLFYNFVMARSPEKRALAFVPYNTQILAKRTEQIEYKLLHEWVETCTYEDIQKELESFAYRLDQCTKIIRGEMRASTPSRATVRISLAAGRALLGVGIYARDWEAFESVVKWYVAHFAAGKNWGARQEFLYDPTTGTASPVPQNTPGAVQIRLYVDDISFLKKLPTIGGPDIVTPPDRGEKLEQETGSHNSHKEPDKPTMVAEIAARNIRRGKRRMTDEEYNALGGDTAAYGT